MSWSEVGLWKMLTDWLKDPQRRWQMWLRVLETYIPATLVLLYPCGAWALAYAAAITLGEFLLYEFVLEPYCGAGPYWERTPPDGKSFIIG
jgi:hypothetical protein